MLNRWFGRRSEHEPPTDLAEIACGDHSRVEIGTGFDLRPGASLHEGLPYPDWAGVYDWIDGLPSSIQVEAFGECERVWLAWLGSQLGPAYRLYESPVALLLTPQATRQVGLAAAYVARTAQRVESALEDLARRAECGKEILIVLGDQDDYYRYVSRFYPEEGEWGGSSGMHINNGCGHFVTYEADLAQMEPVIAHEMTHSLLSHLPLPLWLNEGIAVNTEQRLAGGAPDAWQQRELAERLRAYWNPGSIQQFWSGSAYTRSDEGQELAYELGRVMVRAMSEDWLGFKRFVACALGEDAGAAAARAQLDLDLGESVRVLLDAASGNWGPDPQRWK